MLWNQPSAMAMVLTLATLICGVLSTVSTLKQQSPSSNPVWLIDIVPLATNTGTDNATWVESVAGGQSYIVLAPGFPHPGQDVYINTIYNPRVRQDNLRIFSQEGKPLLNFDCGLAGALSTMVKTTQGQHWIVVSKYWSTDEADKNYLRLHQVSSLNGEVTLTGKVINKLFVRVPLIADLPNTSYFFATSLIAVVRVSMFGSDDNLTGKIGKVSCYANFLEYFEEYDAVLTHFSSGKDLALIDRVTLKFIRTGVFQEMSNEVIFERPRQKNLYTLARTGIEQSYLVKIQISLDSDNLLVSTFRTPPLFCGKATLIELPNLNALLVAPFHFHKATTSVYFGRFLFISKRDFSVELFGTRPSWSVQRMTQAVSPGAGEDHGMRLYVSFMDAVSNNLHFYYMLVDACLESDPTSSACSHCPSGYWRLSASFDPPRRCLKPADFPPVSGMDNSTSQIRPCQVSNCKECTYNLSSCTTCDTSSGFYLDPNQSPPVCIPPEDFPKRFGLDTSKTRVVRCSDPSCLMRSLSAEKCTACDGRTGRYLSGSVCLGSTEMPIGQGPDLQTGRVVQCTSRGCLNCDTDSRVCSRCDLVSGWFLDNKLFRCKQIQDFSPNEGKDPATFRVVNCLQIGCSNCREDYRFCNSNIGPSGLIEVKRSRYFYKTKTAEISFN